MLKVWICFIYCYMGGHGMTVVDNLKDQQECFKVGQSAQRGALSRPTDPLDSSGITFYCASATKAVAPSR